MALPKSSALRSSEDIFSKMLAESKGQSRPEAPPLNTPMMKARTPDIQNVKLPDSMVNSIIESAFNVSKPIEEVQEEPEEIQINESQARQKLNDLVLKLADLIKEAKTVLHEMTTTGMLGTNQKFLLLDKKKNGSNKSNKRK